MMECCRSKMKFLAASWTCRGSTRA